MKRRIITTPYRDFNGSGSIVGIASYKSVLHAGNSLREGAEEADPLITYPQTGGPATT